MKALITLLPNLVKSAFGVWEKSKEWSAKKRIAMFVLVPVSIVAVTLVVKYAGWDNALLATELITEMLQVFSESM